MPLNSSPLQFSDRLKSLLQFYQVAVVSYSWWVIAIVVLACTFSLSFTIAHLGFNTDTTEMLSPELPFHQNRIRFWKTFPQDVKSILVVVDAPSPEASKTIVKRLGDRLSMERSAIESIYVPDQGAFFDEQALLYLEENELEQLVDTLSKTQPLLGRLAQDNSLGGLLEPVGSVLKAPDGEVGFDLKPLLGLIENALANARAGKIKPVSWQNLLTGDGNKFNKTRRFIIVKPKLDFSQLFPAQQALQSIREAAQILESEIPDVSIRMTGETALQHEELESVSKGSAVSAILSLVLVCGTLFLGLRSIKLMFATFLTLIAGLLLTAGFATLAVGHLNMISIAFAVLYIGLGVDYAIHLCLHYRKFLNLGESKHEAIFSAIKTVGPALMLCAVTSAVGFYAYIPTSYSGVSELGVISGTSMFIGLFLTLTLLPASLSLMKVSPDKINASMEAHHSDYRPSPSSWRYRIVRWSALILAVLAAFALPRVTFDFDPVHLRDANAESVRTYNDLVEDPDTSPLTLTLLESDPARVKAAVDKISRLDTVDKVVTIDEFVAKDQEAKLDVIEQMGYVLGPLPQPFPQLSDNDRQSKAFNDFKSAVHKAIEVRHGSELESELIALQERLEQVDRLDDSAGDKERILKVFERNLLTALPSTVTMLQNGLKARAFERDGIPDELSERWLSPEGSYRIQIFPKQDITQLENLRTFVEDVQAIAPNVTDLPVIYLEAGNEVVKAFRQALLTALCAITLVLLIVLRSVRDTVFVLIPLILAAMLTGAASVLIGLPFNFANIIAVPLLFGLGVDSGIHIMHSLRNGKHKNNSLTHNVTTRGIFFSALTTIFSFSSLAFSAHSGTASMGILLAIGILFMLLCTLVVLPAFVSHIYDKPAST